MHRQLMMPRSALLAVVLGCLVAGLSSTRALAQRPIRVETIPIGSSKTVSVAPNKVQKVNVVRAGIVRVEVSADAQAVHLTGEKAGKTHITITDDTGRSIEFDVVVQTDVEFLRYLIRRVAPTANVEPIPVGNKVIILSGTVAKAEDIPNIMAAAQSVAGEGVVNSMRVGGVTQVQLKVVIAQVSRTELRQMSFSFFTQGQQYLFGSAIPGGNAATTLTLGTGAASSALTSANNNNLVFGFIDNADGFFGFLSALRNEGLAKFLAEPCLVTMSGRPASFLSGGRLAVPEPSGLGTNSVRFEDFGTELHFLPIVMGNGKIYLEVEPVVNNVNQARGTTIAGTTVPGFDTQRLHTSVELESGQTFVLGGLIQTELRGTTSKTPVIGDLPFIGAAFRSVSYNQIDTELLIIVTPYLVDPVSCNQLPPILPGQETRTPDDFELFLEGILEAPRGPREVFPGNRYRAAYLNGPTAGTYPCANGSCGYGCNSGRCGSGASLGTVAPANGYSRLPTSISSSYRPRQSPSVSVGGHTSPAGHYEMMPTGNEGEVVVPVETVPTGGEVIAAPSAGGQDVAPVTTPAPLPEAPPSSTNQSLPMPEAPPVPPASTELGEPTPAHDLPTSPMPQPLPAVPPVGNLPG